MLILDNVGNNNYSKIYSIIIRLFHKCCAYDNEWYMSMLIFRDVDDLFYLVLQQNQNDKNIRCNFWAGVLWAR